MDVDKIGGTFVVTNDILGDLPTYVIVDELPKQGEANKRYVIEGEHGYKVYCWRTDGYDLIDAVSEYDRVLEAVETIQTFLEECHCSSAVCWDDDNETVMHTDIGYFFEGLDGLKQYLIGKGAT